MNHNSDLPERHVPNLTDILIWILLGIISYNVTVASAELRALRNATNAHIIDANGRISALEAVQ